MKLRKGIIILSFLFITVGMFTFASTDATAQSRFDSGDDTDDSGSSFNSGDTSSDSNSGSQTSDSNDDGSRFDSGDDTDDSGSSGDTTESDDSSRFDSGDQEDDSGQDESRFDSGDQEDDQGTDLPEEEQEEQREQQEEDDGDQEEQPPQEQQDDGDVDQDGQEQGTTQGSGDYITIDPLDISSNNITLDISPSQAAQGEEVTVSGSINTNQYIDGMPVLILLNDQEIESTEIEGKDFNTTISSNEQGINTVTAVFLDTSKSTQFQVGQGTGLQILDISTTGQITTGNTIEVCTEIMSPGDAEIRFYANGNLQDSTTGSGEVCFDTTVEEGSNEFEIQASSGGETISDSITRNTNSFPGLPNGQDDPQEGNGLLNGMTGNFSDMPSMLNGMGMTSPGLRWLISLLIGLSMTGAILL